MKLLVVGSGGREHALISKLMESPLCEKIYCAPGNGGIAQNAECVDIKANDIESLCEFAKENQIGLTVVGPEDPLVGGIADVFESEGLKIFGPQKAAAAFEGSKALTKEFLIRNNIPTAEYSRADSFEEALAILETSEYPLVIKADGLAAGKGVFICENEEQAVRSLEDIMIKKIFGDSGICAVIEEFLEGTETSVLCFADGKIIVPMTSSRDYKRAHDNDEGLNTGGMGTFSPNPAVDLKMQEKIEKTILNPIMEGFRKESILYKGVLYVGIMIADGIPKVLEFNVRFGDPETQVLMLRLESDLVKIMLKCTDGLLSPEDIVWNNASAVCAVMASGGYPEEYRTGMLISGLENVSGVKVFHAGTRVSEGKLYTDGGRVLNVCAAGSSLQQARSAVYEAVSEISFEGAQYRSDIALTD